MEVVSTRLIQLYRQIGHAQGSPAGMPAEKPTQGPDIERSLDSDDFQPGITTGNTTNSHRKTIRRQCIESVQRRRDALRR